MSGSPILRGPHRPDLRRDETLADILESTATRVPERVALRWGDTELTYRELERRAALAAHHLIARGAGPGACVGLRLPRGPDLLVMQAAIAKSGAAWLPFDADAPADRVAICLADAGAIGVIAERAPALTAWTPAELSAPVAAPLRRRAGLTPRHPAYVIYTSGSTGRPKGIVVEHAAICHLLRAENAVLGVTGDDTVYQGFSVAFDMSFEEIWISYLVGAGLWIAPRQLAADPEALPAALATAGVSVLHAVPTLLALLPGPHPGLRLVNLGGEACPQALADRWARPGLRLFNTYGPTETTVTATLAELRAGEAVTIGQPLPNYGVAVLDAESRPVAPGAVGELCICGPGVARGYLGRAELTAERFVPNPFASGPDEAVLYRSGDLARIGDDGRIHCLGRIDDQIKIRGFRVELGEIEAALAAIPGVGTAAVALRREDGIDRLAAWVVGSPDLAELRAGLRRRLPAYMVPERIALVAALPRLASGKVDRATLAALPLPAPPADDAGDTPADPAEAALFTTLRALFPGQALRRDADFFDDLGGHSLLAARLVSALRADPRFAHLAVQEIYRRRRLAAIAEAMRAAPAVPAPARPTTPASTSWRRIVCGLAQAAVVPVLVCLNVAGWLAPFFTYHHFTGDPGDSIPVAVALSLAVYLAMHAVDLAIAVIGVRLCSLGLRPGAYRLWDWAYFRWWLGQRLRALAPEHLLHASPLYPWYLRALGARIGRDAQLGSLEVGAPWLVTIGDGASLGSSVGLANAHVAGGMLHLATVEIAAETYVGSCSVVAGGTAIGRDGRLAGLAALPVGGRIPADETWDGIPARPAAREAPAHPRLPPPGRLRAVGELALYLLGAVAVATLFFLPIFPTFMIIDWFDGSVLSPSLEDHGQFLVALQYGLLAIPACAVLVALTMLLCAAVRWLVLPRLVPGSWPVHSLLCWRKWLAGQIQTASLEVLHGIYATVYSPSWFRLLGARVGRDAEISTAMGVVPDMLSLGEGSFIADGVMLGDEEVDAGWMTVQRTAIGARSFVGNGAYVPDGTVIPPGVLIGVQSRAPASAAMRPDETWLGSPPLRLPAREGGAGFAEALTFRPTAARRCARGAIEAVRIVLPLALTIGFGYAIIYDVMPDAEAGDWALVALRLALSGLLYGLTCLGLVAALKWLLIGSYRPGAHPMWTPFVWLSEGVTNLYESISVPNCIDMLRGTPLLPWALRLFGARIGRDVWMDTTDLTEFDCVVIGDRAELNVDCGPQTHLFEDRIMKIGTVAIGDGATLHARATVLYDAEIGAGAEVGPLTLVMKGERLPAGTRWCGSPAAPWAPPAL